MAEFEVTGDSLLAQLISALIGRLRADARVISNQVQFAPGAVRIELVGTGRWMVVTSDALPSGLVLQFLGDGATAAIDLAASADEFTHALEALEGNHPAYVSLALLQAISRSRVVQSQAPARLTRRELEIVALVAAGHSNREIAESLFISSNTVRSHLHVLAVKLEARSRTKIVARARALGLLSHVGAERRTERSSA